MLDERDAIDRHIDGVARAMIDGEPRADFTVRVMRRIAAPRTHAGAWLWTPAAAAAVVVLIVVSFHRPQVSAPAGPVAPVSARPTSPAVEPPALMPAPVVAIADAKPAPAVRARPDRVAAERPMDVDVEPLSVQPMHVPALDPLDPTAPGAIGIEQLSVAPINIEGENK